MAAAEMAFAGGLGLTLDLKLVPGADGLREDFILFSESPSWILLEVSPERALELENKLAGLPIKKIGQFESGGKFRALDLDGKPVIETAVEQLRRAWEEPFRGW